MMFWILVVLLTSTACFSQDACTTDWTSAPKPKVIMVRHTGHLYSPGYEENQPYPNSIHCAYQLQAPAGMHVRLKFSDLDIDVTDGCEADSVQIYDFDRSGYGILKGMHCGNEIPHDYVSQATAFQVRFKTDYFAAKRGFNITYSLQSSTNLCSAGQVTCRNRKCVKRSVTCNNVDDCGDGTDEENCHRPNLYVTDCGVPDVKPLAEPFDRIVGGQEAIAGSWPWMADLQFKLIQPNGHTCGGTLINAQWVLTAAHCFMDEGSRTPENWRIHLGNHRKFERDEYEQIRFVERIVIYDDIPNEKFARDGEFDMMNDMALIKLNAPVKFNKHVKPVCLPGLYDDDDIGITSDCFATGWGVTRGSGGSDVLKQAFHPVQANIFCKRLAGISFVPRNMICAGSLAPKNGVCNGDSGGPLVCKIKKIWKIMGVASYVTDSNGIEGLCGLKGHPSVFGKVTQKLGWIRKILNRYS